MLQSIKPTPVYAPQGKNITEYLRDTGVLDDLAGMVSSTFILLREKTADDLDVYLRTDTTDNLSVILHSGPVIVSLVGKIDEVSGDRIFSSKENSVRLPKEVAEHLETLARKSGGYNILEAIDQGNLHDATLNHRPPTENKKSTQ